MLIYIFIDKLHSINTRKRTPKKRENMKLENIRNRKRIKTYKIQSRLQSE